MRESVKKSQEMSKKGSRSTPDQIITKMRELEVMQREGMRIGEAARKLILPLQPIIVGVKYMVGLLPIYIPVTKLDRIAEIVKADLRSPPELGAVTQKTMWPYFFEMFPPYINQILRLLL